MKKDTNRSEQASAINISLSSQLTPPTPPTATDDGTINLNALHALLETNNTPSTPYIDIDKLWDEEDNDPVFTNMMMQTSYNEQMVSQYLEICFHQLMDELHDT